MHLTRFMRHFSRLFLPILILTFTTGCQVNKGNKGKLIDSGTASWYGPGFHGRLTANGEKFNMNDLTAAHRTLAFGTIVKVVNQDNGKSVVVRINDRGPYAKNRVIDLSKKAAKQLDMIGPGTAKVSIYQISNTDNSRVTDVKTPHYTVQVGSYDSYQSAKSFSQKLDGIDIVKVKVDGATLYRLYFGKFTQKSSAEAARQELAIKGISGFVKQMEN